ncbi:MAG: hypothetical protein Q4G11_06975 [Gallicola sp.]|nr:hypothetical protein [Gallicola sp.]
MAKSLVRNKISSRTFGFIASADATATKAFCDAHLDGTYAIYESAGKTGNETEAAFNRVTVTGKATDGRKTSFSFYSKSTLNEDEIRAALREKTYNGVKFDEVYIIHMQAINLGTTPAP